MPARSGGGQRKPPTPKVTPKPPTPTIQEERELLRRKKRKPRRTGTATAIDQPTVEELAQQPTVYGWQTPAQQLQAFLGRASRGFVSAFGLPEVPIYGRGGVPYSMAGYGRQTGDWRRYLGKIQQGLQPYGFGYGPTWGQPGGFLGGPGSGTGAGAYPPSVYGAVGGLMEKVGVVAGAIMPALAEIAAGRPPLSVPTPDYGYGPSIGGYGRYRRPTASVSATSYGLVNWRIGL